MFVEPEGVTKSFVERISHSGLHKSNRGVWGLHKASPLETEKKERLRRDLQKTV